ncbi:MAG: hypothetical protein KGJ87_01395 [Planctomycetota bacterium]|nr:hypothetical protein [Planctomycetota bacterium]MDE1888688.1 hypothetical protein [Planctomycetota bacterium]MDE2215810.1 hypothetical protein [Planctomycetota bacterium]
MKRVIGVKDLQDSGLLDTKYTELDLYDAFMMYLILNDTSDKGRVVLQEGDYMLDSISCFGLSSWVV